MMLVEHSRKTFEKASKKISFVGCIIENLQRKKARSIQFLEIEIEPKNRSEFGRELTCWKKFFLQSTTKASSYDLRTAFQAAFA